MSNRPNPPKRRNPGSGGGGGGSLLWLWITIAVIFVVAIIGAVVIAASGGDDAADGGGASPSGGTVVPSGDSEFGGPVTVSGTNLPSSDLAGKNTDPAIGETLPRITGTQFEGSPITIEPGKPMIIMGVAHWCPHCQAEVPRIQEWLDENGMPADVELVTIATANDLSRGNGPAGEWLRGDGWSVPTLLDDEEGAAAEAIGLTGFPFFVVVDAEGEVVLRASGELTMSQFEQLLDAARTGQFPT